MPRKKPTKLPTPVPVEPPVVVAPSVNPVPPLTSDGAITLATPWASIGVIDLAQWRRLLTDASSPMLPDLDAIWHAAQPHNALALAQAYKESSLGKDATARQALNPLGLMVRPGEPAPYVITAAGRRLQVFPSWAEAFENYVWRLGRDPYTKTTTLEELIDLYLLGWLPGQPGTYPSGESAANARLYKSQTVERLNAWGAAAGEKPPPPPPTEPSFPWPVRWHEVEGLPGKKIALPADCNFTVLLTKVGPNRPGRKTTHTGGTQHETGNRGVGAGAGMHSRWQDSGTPGHPDGKVAVHFYTDDKEVIQKIPVHETGIHAGDARNQTQWSNELCVNADRKSAISERNAQALDAGLLWAMGKTALADLYPHSPSGCPAIINARGGWKAYEAQVDALIRCYKGGTPPPAETTYAEAFPVPREWDGTDWRREDGALFVALRRVFVAAEDEVRCIQSANPTLGPEFDVRRPLKKGEGFESHYVTRGTDGWSWLVSRWGSRIKASQCLPGLDTFNVSEERAADRSDWDGSFSQTVETDPTAGLSGGSDA